MPVLVIGEFRFPADRLAEALPAMERVVTLTRAEKGCLAYSYGEDVLDPGLIRVSEKWDSAEDLSVHLAAPHMAAWKQQREALGLTGRSITMYEVSGEKAV